MRRIVERDLTGRKIGRSCERVVGMRKQFFSPGVLILLGDALNDVDDVLEGELDKRSLCV